LINVDMDDAARTNDNLRKKRTIELGSGRAGGYAGYDDDEFDGTGGIFGCGDNNVRSPRGRGGEEEGIRGEFAGGDGMVAAAVDDEAASSSFGRGGTIAASLAPRGPRRVASDFLAHDEEDDDDDGGAGALGGGKADDDGGRAKNDGNKRTTNPRRPPLPPYR